MILNKKNTFRLAIISVRIYTFAYSLVLRISLIYFSILTLTYTILDFSIYVVIHSIYNLILCIKHSKFVLWYYNFNLTLNFLKYTTYNCMKFFFCIIEYLIIYLFSFYHSYFSENAINV